MTQVLMLAFTLRILDKSGEVELQYSQPCDIWMVDDKPRSSPKETV